jgi:hypothetical protein
VLDQRVTKKFPTNFGSQTSPLGRVDVIARYRAPRRCNEPPFDASREAFEFARIGSVARRLPRDRVTCHHRQLLVDRQPATERDPFRVSQRAAIAVGHEQAAVQRSSDTNGLPVAHPPIKADIEHKKLFPAVTNPAALGATPGVGVLAPTPAAHRPMQFARC